MSPLARVLAILCTLLSAMLAGCSGLDAVNALGRSDGYFATTGVTYAAEPRQKLDIYEPKESLAGEAARPIVVFFYGGNWRSGGRADYRFVAEALTSRGYVVVIPDYRLYPAVKFPAFVEDGALAVAWTHAHATAFGADPQKLFVMGHSAGAHIAALLTLDERYLRAAGLSAGVVKGFVGLAGPYNFAPTGENRHVFEVGDAGSQLAPDFEPLDAVRKGTPPMLLIHGEDDTTVNPDNATALAMAVNTQGGHARVVLYKGRSHVGVLLALARGFRGLSPTLDDVAAFVHEIAAAEPKDPALKP